MGPTATPRPARARVRARTAYAPGVDGGDISRRGLLGGFFLDAA